MVVGFVPMFGRPGPVPPPVPDESHPAVEPVWLHELGAFVVPDWSLEVVVVVVVALVPVLV